MRVMLRQRGCLSCSQVLNMGSSTVYTSQTTTVRNTIHVSQGKISWSRLVKKRFVKQKLLHKGMGSSSVVNPPPNQKYLWLIVRLPTVERFPFRSTQEHYRARGDAHLGQDSLHAEHKAAWPRNHHLVDGHERNTAGQVERGRVGSKARTT